MTQRQQSWPGSKGLHIQRYTNTYIYVKKQKNNSPRSSQTTTIVPLFQQPHCERSTTFIVIDLPLNWRMLVLVFWTSNALISLQIQRRLVSCGLLIITMKLTSLKISLTHRDEWGGDTNELLFLNLIKKIFKIILIQKN